MLAQKGYVDTIKKALKNSYINNVYINASINGMTIHQVNIYRNAQVNRPGYLYTELDIEWQLLDYYKNVLYTHNSKNISGQFVLYSSKNMEKELLLATKDAIEFGLIEFFSKDEVIQAFNDSTALEEEASLDTIVIRQPDNAYVSNLNEAIQSSVTIVTNEGHGSGFFIGSDGYIITNYHVIADASGLKVVMNNEKEYEEVEIVRVSKIHDLALLKIKANNILPFKISKDKNIEIAKDVYVVGTPSAQDLSQSISKGIISGIRKTDMDSKLIQTDASVNGGNSGGAIVDKQGLVIGIVSSKLKGFGIEGVAFGIPAYEIADKLKVVVK